MFWKNKIKTSEPLLGDGLDEKRDVFPFPERHCSLFISSKYVEIIFVPFGKIDPWKSRELDAVVVKNWPLNIGELQDTIQETLDKWKSGIEDIDPSNANWHSFNASKAKTQKSFQVDYVEIDLRTDLERGYGQGEVERILINASPKNWQDDNYKIIGKDHLMETKVAQIVIDIFNACEKIRAN